MVHITDKMVGDYYGEYERPSRRRVIAYCDDCQDEI